MGRDGFVVAPSFEGDRQRQREHEDPVALTVVSSGSGHERADNHTPVQRSRTMSRIRSSNTGPELILRKALWQNRLRGYRLHAKRLPGKPDIAWTRRKVAVFVDGAFWHGHPSAFKPGKSGAYWDAKIARNMVRDQAVNVALRELGWSVVRLWDFEIRTELDRCVMQIASALAH